MYCDDTIIIMSFTSQVNRCAVIKELAMNLITFTRESPEGYPVITSHLT